MMNLTLEQFLDLQADIHQTAVSKGWWPPCPTDRPVPEILLLIHSEIDEAVIALEDDISQLETELADIAIRLLDFAQGYQIPLITDLIKSSYVYDYRPVSTSATLLDLHVRLTEAFQFWRKSDIDGFHSYLADTFAILVSHCNQYEQLNLLSAIQRKNKHNKTRPPRS